MPSPPRKPVAHMTVEEKRAFLKEILLERTQGNKESFPLSHGQMTLWFLHLLAPEMSSYNVAVPASASPPLDLKTLQTAFDHVVSRHEALRSVTISGEQELAQEVRAGTVQIRFQEARGETRESIHRRATADYRRPFTLESELPIRASLYRADGHDVLLVTVHHIAFDAWSASIFIEQLRSAYAALTGCAVSATAPASASYRDYVSWQRGMLKQDGDRLAGYWTRRLAGELPVLRLPSSKQRPDINSFSGGSIPLTFARSLLDGLRLLAKQERTTLFSVLLAAWSIHLALLGDSDAVITGVPVSGRTRPEWMLTIGYFVNTLPIRLRLMRQNGFRAHIREAAQAMQEALTHQDFPFALIVEKLKIRRDTPGSPVFQNMLNLHRAPARSEISVLFQPGADADVVFGASRLHTYPLSQQEGQFDLVLELLEGESFLGGHIKYSNDVMDPAYASRVRDQFLDFLSAAVERPDESVTQFGHRRETNLRANREELIL